MDINIIISGNLTGFSRFYATPNANELYVGAKFDFDYRNYLTFLNKGEKAYAISFAPHVVSVSLITRILDSFRRPGILVVSVLLQRGMIVDSIINPQNKNTIYRLLNDINDKFYERNFKNGMINQNAAVLMQDYYSDILSNYKLTSDINQKKVNGNIDVNTPNKRLGYIAANDIDMPLYLSSLYRRSYEGFHHVFFAPNAPQNIDETPDEVVMYRVYITNNKMTLPTLVKLTDQIYKLTPNPGEIDFDQNYTYGDILQGKAGNQIRASIVGETLEVSYRFKEEEKTINFVFEDNGDVISLTHIAPIIVETDGTKVPLSTESFKFIGKEIYGRKIIQSTNPKYTIRTEYSTIDLQRLNDGATCHIQVESNCIFEIRFQHPYDVPKTIKLKRRNNNKVITIPDVTGYLKKTLPGELTEWDYTIESKEYQTASGNLGNQQELTLHPKPVTDISVATVGHDNDMPHDTSNKNGFQKGTLKLSGASEKPKEPQKDKKLNIKKVLLVSSPLLITLIYICISWQFNIWPWDKDEQESIISDVSDNQKKTITVEILDYNGDSVNKDNDYNSDIALPPYIDDIECKLSGDIKSDTIAGNLFVFSAPNNCTDKISFKLKFTYSESQYFIICDSTIYFDKFNDGDIIKLKLNVRTSAIVLFKKLYNDKGKPTEDKWVELKKDYSNYNELNEKDGNPNSSFDKELKNLYDKVKKKYEHKGEEEETSPTDDTETSSYIKLDKLSKLDCTIDNINRIEKILKNDGRLQKATIDNIPVTKRIEALKGALTTLRIGYEGRWLPSTKNLSKEQADFITNKIRPNERKINIAGKRGDFKKIKSMQDFKKKLIDNGIIKE